MIIITILLILIGLYVFMICPRVWGKVDRAPFKGVDYAHRGLFDNESEAPENSLLAIKKAVDAGYGIEFDVQLSKDDIPVVFHDASLKRMCGIEGKVWDYTLEELQKMSLAKSAQTIPTFEDVLSTVGGKVPLIIEYKMDRVDTKVCVLGNELLKNYKGTYCVESFHPMAVRWYKKNRPDVMRGQLCEEYWRYNNNFPKVLAYFLGYLLSNFITRPDFIAYKHQDAKNISRRICTVLGALPVCFTVKKQEEYDNAKKYFQLIIFDSFIPKK